MEQPNPQESSTNPTTWYDRLLQREGVDHSMIMNLDQVTDVPQWVVVVNHEIGSAFGGTLARHPDSEHVRFIPYEAGKPAEITWDWSPADLGLCPRTPGGSIKADNRVYLPPATPEE